MEQPQEFNHELEVLVDGLNEKLRAAGADSAERAFGLGCLLGLLPAFGIILALFLFKVINIILAFVLVGLASLAILGGVMLISYQARLNSFHREYRSGVEAEINRFLNEHNISRQHFDKLALSLLPENAPLSAFLSQETLERVFGQEELE